MKPEYIELMNHRAMIEIPENSVEVILHIKVYDSGEIKEVAAILDQEMIRDAFQKADNYYLEDDDMFVITDAGLKYLEERKNGPNNQ